LGWGIIELVNDVLLQLIHKVVSATNFLFMNVDEMTPMDKLHVFIFTFMLFKLGSGSLFKFVWKRLMCMG
jgi:hypothetical protein